MANGQGAIAALPDSELQVLVKLYNAGKPKDSPSLTGKEVRAGMTASQPVYGDLTEEDKLGDALRPEELLYFHPELATVLYNLGITSLDQVDELGVLRKMDIRGFYLHLAISNNEPWRRLQRAFDASPLSGA